MLIIDFESRFCGVGINGFTHGSVGRIGLERAQTRKLLKKYTRIDATAPLLIKVLNICLLYGYLLVFVSRLPLGDDELVVHVRWIATPGDRCF